MSVAACVEHSEGIGGGVEAEASRREAALRRLPFRLADFTRIAWTSDAARTAWEPRIRRIGQAWHEVEWRAVAAGVRRCAILSVSPEQLVQEAPRWAEQGLSGMPIAINGVTECYSATSTPAQPGKPFSFRTIVGTPQSVRAFKLAYDASDEDTIGSLLGYPACCREFYRRVWVEEGLVDTTWAMAVGTVGGPLTPDPSPARGEGRTFVELSGPAQANILWRWMGVRCVPHLPCSFTCAATVELAERLLAVGRELGYAEEMGWMLEILDWPAQWSALHGVAEIKTPVLKVSTRTDATSCTYTVRYLGRRTPAEALAGVRFPFLPPSREGVTESAGFRRGLEHQAEDSPLTPSPSPARGEGSMRRGFDPVSVQPSAFSLQHSEYASDNGFSSIAAMDAAHEPILAAAAPVLAAGGGVLDLGCGNGALLKKFCDAHAGVVPYGIDLDAGRIARARELLPEFAENFLAGDVFEAEELWPAGRRYSLVLLMPGRLIEAGLERSARLRARLREHCDHLLIYAYGDWRTRYGKLANLAQAAGLRLTDGSQGQFAGLAEPPIEAGVTDRE